MVILLSLLLIGLAKGQDVSVNNGKINIREGVSCNVTLYNRTIYNATQEIPGLHYGLVAHVCTSGSKGYYISSPKCFNCGIYCPQNDMLLNCNQFWFPFLMGLAVGTPGAVIIVWILITLKNRYYPQARNYIKHTRDAKRERKYRKIQNFLEVQEKEKNTPNTQGHSSRRNSLTTVLFTSLLASSHLKETSACDRSLYITSANTICETSNCISTNTFLLNLEKGMKVCFNGDVTYAFAIRFKDYRATATYSYIYKTSEFKIKTKTHGACKTVDGCERGRCKKVEKYPSFKEENNRTVYGYGCEWSSAYYGVCFFGGMCTWYQWSVALTGPQYKVYKLNHKGFELEFEISINNVTRTEILSDRSLNMNLDLLDVKNRLNFPLSVISTLGPEKYTAPHIAEVDNHYYDVDASELNLPLKNRVGDIQIDNNQQITIDSSLVKCYADNNAVDCRHTKPAIEVIKDNKKPEDFRRYERVTDNIVRTKSSLQRSVSLMFSHSNIKSLEVSNPSCKMAVSYSYGCRECNQNPQVIVSSSDIRQEGMIYFKSNCSFNRQYLSCSYYPQTIELLDDKEYCYIYIEKINTTLNIHIKYEFVGEVIFNPYYTSEPDNFQAIMGGVISNPNFVDGLFKSFVITSSVLLVITTVVKAIGRIMVLRMAGKAAKREETV